MNRREYIRSSEVVPVDLRPGLNRRTLAFNGDLMMCIFEQRKGVSLERHCHAAVQNGYVLSGAIQFTRGDGTRFIAGAGDSYVFDSNEEHGSLCMEDARFIESFTPCRPEYLPGEDS